MSNQLLPSSAREGNTLGFRLAQQTFTPSSHNNPAAINKYFGSGWAFGPCPETVDAAYAIGGGRVGDIVPVDYCQFHFECDKIGPWSGAPCIATGWHFGRSTPSEVVQGSGSSTGEFSFPSRRFVPGWDGAAPTSGTELWALRSGRWYCEVTYTKVGSDGSANADLLFRTLATTIGVQSQATLPSSHPITGSGTVSFTETVDLLAHPLWLPAYNLVAGWGGVATFNALANGRIFDLDAEFTRLGLPGT